MIENITLFLTHLDGYLDACLGVNGQDDGFESIRQMKKELKAKGKNISLDEFHKQESDIFYHYLQLIECINQ